MAFGKNIQPFGFHPILPGFLPQNSVFGNQRFNGILLLLIYPHRQNEKKHLPGMQNHFHADSALFLEEQHRISPI
jgi:hypothetical protein